MNLFSVKIWTKLAWASLALAGGALALPLEESLRPIARQQSPVSPEEQSVPILVASTAKRLPESPTALDRPTARLTAQVAAYKDRTIPTFVPEQEAVVLAAFSPMAVGRSLRPEVRTDDMVTLAMSKKRRQDRQAKRGGGLCGDPDIQGEYVGYVPGRLSACGVKEAVKVTSVSGVSLSTGAVMDCTTAKALKTWVDKGAIPAFGRKGGGLDKLRVAAGYACRTRNNQAGAKISEHGKGKAIDISGFWLENGTEVSVLKGWKSKSYGQALRKMHKAACGPFGTVLGPNSNRFHQDHFHFDTASHRGGSYCR